MIVAVGGNGWRLRTAGSMLSWGTQQRMIFAVDPDCPPAAHGIRNCRCRAFKRDSDAREYIRQHDD